MSLWKFAIFSFYLSLIMLFLCKQSPLLLSNTSLHLILKLQCPGILLTTSLLCKAMYLECVLVPICMGSTHNEGHLCKWATYMTSLFNRMQGLHNIISWNGPEHFEVESSFLNSFHGAVGESLSQGKAYND